MKFLALETSTDTLSVALGAMATAPGSAGPTPVVLGHYSGAGGAQSSATLLPAISQLLADAGWRLDELDAIVFGAGPGSFTGLRTACSVAQGLALGAGLRVIPVDTLMCVAEEARYQYTLSHPGESPCSRVAAAMDARMDEIYLGVFEWPAGLSSPSTGLPAARGEAGLAAPEALDLPADTLVAGNARAVFGERLPAATRALPFVHCLPTATALLRLAPALLQRGDAVDPALAMPRYVRDKVAKTTAERLAERQAAAVAAAPR
ncbi:tRNA threonylcarbamoyladenosine biosynthesis protein TsaB [Comamonas sp. BIGb0124]|uniref:tRNA (adenosine(37)-N6)-threonylcarbamoyltransferase complex dimerization subunit type 1 TsaB n=1 Tax=Comamonas sp. BIGb0124 TaxID=2485130 RepID=UPI000F460CDF|nr:tRNA (adenosine(37)-N6)-threonylcarbamoyltransferase complex dimerization subunit type 1 TsaB [Comamonas sp. BIGb0124]ROR20265.1 tRNA threonylcarbamoyladenosine biosynthesis protein TsaB [Comamonas sp. BIGb0124]